jgi:hypothetical protein
MNVIKICLMSALLIGVTLSAFGQQRPAPMSEERREEIRKKIDAVRIWRLTEELKLDAITSAKLSSLLSSVDHQRREILRQQTGTINILRFAVKAPKPDESRLKIYLENLERNHRAMQELVNSERSGLKNILTIEQQARYVVFQHAFIHEMRDMIGGAQGYPGQRRMGVGGGVGMGGGHGQIPDGTGQGTIPSPGNENQLQNRSQ